MSIPEACWSCQLDDCYPTNARCNLRIKEMADKGIKPTRKPAVMRWQSLRVKIRQCDLDTLTEVCREDKRSLADELSTLVGMLADCRRRGINTFG